MAIDMFRHVSRYMALFCVIASIFSLGVNANTISPVVDSNQSIQLQATLTPHVPIYISGDIQFNATNGVNSGTGTQIDPYIIEDWDINASCADGIKIENTNAYFIIRKCNVFDGTYNGGFNYGIYLSVANNSSVQNCTSTRNSEGLHIWESEKITVLFNNVSLNSDGIWIGGSSLNIIFRNNIFSNTNTGLSQSWSANNTITYNNITNNDKYGILMGKQKNYSYVHHNNFIDNNGGTAQANDTSEMVYWNTSIEGNHWSDWISPDTDQNGIVDNPYILEGNKGANDSRPLVELVSNAGNGFVYELPNVYIITLVALIPITIMIRRRSKHKKHDIWVW